MMNKNKFQLNTFSLKLIACLFMLIDHIAMILIPQSHPAWLIMRMIGRMSAPIFFYTLSEGLKRTSNRRKYLGRLLVSACIMGAGNGLLGLLGASVIENPPTILQPNIFLIMFLIGLGIHSLESCKNSGKLKTLLLFIISVISFSLVIYLPGYQWLALSSVLSFYIVKQKWARDLVYMLSSLLICLLTQQYVQIFMVLSILFITNSSEEKPKHNLKMFFYMFYPMHLWILYCLSILI